MSLPAGGGVSASHDVPLVGMPRLWPAEVVIGGNSLVGGVARDRKLEVLEVLRATAAEATLWG